MCRFEWRDLLRFFLIVLPFFVTVIAGAIRGGYGWGMWIVLAYALFFFFVWEARVLCSHCPMWAEPSRALHCHANHGVLKIWPYRPGPMGRSEKAQFIIGALILIVLPLVFVALGGEYLLLTIGAVCAVSATYTLRRSACNECINFSCPMNTVEKRLVDAYLLENPEMLHAWRDDSYSLG